MLEYLPPDMVSFARPGSKPENEKIAEVTVSISKLNLGKRDTVVIDLISNVTWEGMRLACRTPRLGQRMVGFISLAFWPVPYITAIKKQEDFFCSPLLTEVEGADIILVCQTPCYVTG
jgi:hypothetical protein